MSDPITNVEIEDVLSSIRRLIADESRGRGAEDAAADADAAPSAEVRPLVLTPDRRVGPPPEDASQPEPAAPEPGAEAEAEAEAEAGPAPEAGDPDAIRAAAEDLAEDVAEDAAEIAGEPAERRLPDWLAQATEGADWAPSSLEDRISVLENAISAEPQDWEPDGSEVRPGAAARMPWEETDQLADAALARIDAREDGRLQDRGSIEPPARPVAAAPEPVPEPEPEPEPMAQEAEEASVDLSDGIAVAGEEAAEWEDAEDEPAGSIVPPDDAAGAVLHAPEMPDEAAGDVDATQGEAVLDEDTLREMVAEIVRAELQGRLGERITRNVRKLVRREIHRALAARDLD